MDRKKSFSISDAILVLLLGYVIWCRMDRSAADLYAARVYPAISSFLSRVSSLVPFSLEELLVVVFVIVIILVIVDGVRKRKKWHAVLLKEVKWLTLIYVWFYIGWGLNYSRSSLAQRLETPVAKYDEDAFRSFLEEYASQLNSSYELKGQHTVNIVNDIKSFYATVLPKAGLCEPQTWQKPKTALATGLFSKVGVTGSMGPFMSESLLNGEMPDNEYPFTAAHEFSHLMGVSNEAEANFWAFRYCQSSSDVTVQYSGYLTLLGNVLRNARRLLPEDDYSAYVASIREEVRQEFSANREYWSSKYSRFLGQIQDKLYNVYLKGNGISSGTKNYDEVISLLMSDFEVLPKKPSAPTQPEEPEIEVVVDDATGEILGIKVNEVGDFYIINPMNEEMIPMEGHSIRKL